MNCNTTHYRANSSSVPGDPTLSAVRRGPRRASLGLGLASLVVLVVWTAATKPAHPPRLLEGWNGVLQRATLLPFLAWVVVAALHELKEDAFSPRVA